jgi:hypothetical protein
MQLRTSTARGRTIGGVSDPSLLWQLLLAGPLAVLGAITARAGWLGIRGRLRPPRRVGVDRRREAAFAAAARVAGPPLLAAGGIAVLGAVAAVVQRDLAAAIVVSAVAGAGACALALATRRLVDRAATAVLARPAGRAACAGCPIAGRADLKAACCASH